MAATGIYLKKALDCRLYTPTVDDYKICTLSTLNCFTEEVAVLNMEMEDKSLRVLALSKRLKKLMSNCSSDHTSEED